MAYVSRIVCFLSSGCPVGVQQHAIVLGRPHEVAAAVNACIRLGKRPPFDTGCELSIASYTYHTTTVQSLTGYGTAMATNQNTPDWASQQTSEARGRGEMGGMLS